jgi:hypothetical protein
MSEHLDSSAKAVLERIAERQTNVSTKEFLKWMASKGIRKWSEPKEETNESQSRTN